MAVIIVPEKGAPVLDSTGTNVPETNEARLKRENDILRALISKLNLPCVYCGLTDMSRCAQGFPGCGQADDLMVGDEETMQRLLADNRRLQKLADGKASGG